MWCVTATLPVCVRGIAIYQAAPGAALPLAAARVPRSDDGPMSMDGSDDDPRGGYRVKGISIRRDS